MSAPWIQSLNRRKQQPWLTGIAMPVRMIEHQLSSVGSGHARGGDGTRPLGPIQTSIPGLGSSDSGISGPRGLAPVLLQVQIRAAPKGWLGLTCYLLQPPSVIRIWRRSAGLPNPAQVGMAP